MKMPNSSQYSQFLDVVRAEFGPDSRMVSQFEALEMLYSDWNARINVISRKDMDSLYMRHVLHSLAIAAYLKNEKPGVYEALRLGGKKILDVGTGGGFPGIPLAILFPNTDFVLCDSVGKKIKVVEAVADALGLKNVRAVNARVETLPDTFDYVVSRAVTSLDNFYPWVAGKFRESIFYLKGGDISGEIENLRKIGPARNLGISLWDIYAWCPQQCFEAKVLVDISL